MRIAATRLMVSGLVAAGVLALASARGTLPGREAGAQSLDESMRYLDDRSSPDAVLRSYANALNRREYVRAYSYWEPEAAAAKLPLFDQFEAGFAQTDSVRLETGAVTGDAGAGQFYFSVPVILTATTTSGETRTFVGCYTLHLSNPGIQSEPPYRPLAIVDAEVAPVSNDADTASLMEQACGPSGGGQPPLTPTVPPAPDDISASRYLDDRSGPARVLQSYLNAVNRHGYARAYGYWPEGAAGLPPFGQFAAGFASTVSAELAIGEVSSDAGAGQRRYAVPATVRATMTDGTVQTFVGCYVLHISQPSIQGIPPFRPLAIESARVQQVAPDADTSDLMAHACDIG